MVNYVNTVLVSNVGGVATAIAPKATKAAAIADAGKFIIANCDANVAQDKLYDVTAANAGSIDTIKVGMISDKVAVVRDSNGGVKYVPVVKWSNEIKAADIKSFNSGVYAADTEDQIVIDFSNLDATLEQKFGEGGKRIIVRLTFKDMPHRFRKWTESYEYVTVEGDDKDSIATNIANMINREYKRARVEASANAGVLTLVALPYDDDDAVDTLNWAAKVRFNANIYYTNPAADGWESKNKHFPIGVTINKTPGKQYVASSKLVRDREAWAMGYDGILNRGEGTWPIIKPGMNTVLSNQYDYITLEFENMYRAADDIQRKTKQTLEVYSVSGSISGLKQILDAFVG